MKKFVSTTTIAAILSVCATMTYAITPGIYVGGAAGYGMPGKFKDAERVGHGAAAGRVFAGYNINNFFGVEADYAIFSKTKYTVEDWWFGDIKTNYDLSALMLMGKVYLPLDKRETFNLYTGLGVAEVFGKIHGDLIQSASRHTAALAASVGATYNVTNNIFAGVDYTATTGKNGNDNHIGIPATGLVSFSLGYHFG